MTTGKIKTLFSDVEKTEALFPQTKVEAISDKNGKGLGAILENYPTFGETEGAEDSFIAIDADSLGGLPSDQYASKAFVREKIMEAQVGGGVDLNDYAKKEDLEKIDFPVDSVNGQTGAVQLSASDVKAREDTWTPTASDVGAVPTTRKINDKMLSDDITLSATDVGARPNTWTPTVSDVGAVPTSRTVNGKALSSNITLSASDVSARPSTWMPTATDVGAAPSGYGYGEKMRWLGFDEASWSSTGTFQADLEAAFASLPQGSCMQVQFIDTKLNSQKFEGTLWKYTSAYGFLTATNYSGVKAIKTFYNNTWNPWEWENPPMSTNVEYRTTERHLGNPVYVKKFKIDSLPQGTNTITHDLGIGVTELVRFEAYALHPTDYIYYPIPMISSSGNISATARVRAAKADIICFSDLSDYTGYITIWYCKN